MFSLRSLGPLTVITTSSPATSASISTFKESLALLTVKVDEFVVGTITFESSTE